MPIASASANRAVHQRTECEKKHNRAPNRVPIRQILAARRGVAYSWEGGGCGGTYGNGVLYLLFTFLHSVHGVSLRGSVSVGSGVRGRLPLSCVVEPRTRPLPPASGGSCAASRALRRDRRCVLQARWRCPRRGRRLSSGIRYQRVETGCQPIVCRVAEDLVVGGLILRVDHRHLIA